MPGGAIDIIGDELKRVASQGNGTLVLRRLPASSGTLERDLRRQIALLFSQSGLRGRGETRLHQAQPRQPHIYNLSNRRPYSGARSNVALPVALDHLGLSTTLTSAAKLVSWPMLMVVIALALAFVYRFGPSRREPKWRWVTWGSVPHLSSPRYCSLYAANFGSFNKTYGSLGAIIGFMVWIWVSMIGGFARS